MKNLNLFIVVLLTTLFTVSCLEDHNEVVRTSSKLELRQLVNNDEVVKSTSGSFFLVGGSVNSDERTESKIKMYVKLNDFYQYVEYNLIDVKIKIDNTIEKPYIEIKYNSHHKREKISDYALIKEPNWYTNVTLTTPEKYLPEYLLPINIK